MTQKRKPYFYEISPALLESIKEVTRQLAEMSYLRPGKPALQELILAAVTRSSYSSTSIEGNPLPLTEVKKIIKNRPENLRNSEKEVLNYNDTLLWLNDKIDSGAVVFDMKLILDIHKRTMKGLLSPGHVGKLRNEAVFVNDPKARKTIYWPPDHQDVTALLEDLFLFVRNNIGKLDALLLAGIFHRQFVIIHPFLDGNGRTVRLATKVLLAHLGFNLFHIFSFENYYNKNVSQYFEYVGLRGNYYDLASKVDFTRWLEYFATGVIDELLRIRKELQENRSPENEVSNEQKKIIEHIRKHGFIRDRDYAKITARAKATRAGDFKKLLDLGVLERHGGGPATYYKLKP
jgi:Fic family protein